MDTVPGSKPLEVKHDIIISFYVVFTSFFLVSTAMFIMRRSTSAIKLRSVSLSVGSSLAGFFLVSRYKSTRITDHGYVY